MFGAIPQGHRRVLSGLHIVIDEVEGQGAASWETVFDASGVPESTKMKIDPADLAMIEKQGDERNLPKSPEHFVTHEVGHGVDDFTPGLLKEFIREFGKQSSFREDVRHPLTRDGYTKKDREFFAEAYAGWVLGSGQVPADMARWFERKMGKGQ